jgi:hypothetical protein
MGGMNVSPEYLRAVRGAFAWAHIWAHPDVLIRVDEEDRASLFTHVLGYHWPRVPLRVTVSCPYGRPDPRGPDAGESVHISYDAQGRMIRGRPPAEVGAIVPLDLSAGELEKHALATRMRLDRELDRGYRAVQSSVPPPDHIARERPALPQHAGGRYLDVGELIRYRRRSMEGRPTVRVPVGPAWPQTSVDLAARAARRAMIAEYHVALRDDPLRAAHLEQRAREQDHRARPRAGRHRRAQRGKGLDQIVRACNEHGTLAATRGASPP